jgi:hypothetical protein
MRDFARTFGMNEAASATAVTTGGRQDLPKADVWMNIGYPVTVAAEDGSTETRFVSLPVGIALDTQKPITITTRSPELAELQANQNRLLADLQKYAEGLQPGEETLINLSIQLRRVKDPVVAPVAGEDSAFARKVDFAMPAAKVKG